VSDEFTVPLCRGHHREAHRCGDEAAFWQGIGIDPSSSARALWLKTPSSPRPLKSNAEIAPAGVSPRADLGDADGDRPIAASAPMKMTGDHHPCRSTLPAPRPHGRAQLQEVCGERQAPSPIRRAADPPAVDASRSKMLSRPSWRRSTTSTAIVTTHPFSAPEIALRAPAAAPEERKSLLSHPEPRRFRDKEHVKFVAKQPCLRSQGE
jgi:hypothetical protein